MKNIHIIITILFFSLFIFIFSCASDPKTNVVEIENKGTVMGASAPNWLKIYLERGVSALNALPEFRSKYCVVGEETGVNRQFVIAWADSASAQGRIGSLVRTNIASRYEAVVNAQSQTNTQSAASYQQGINNVLNAIVNISFSGAQREADWWSLRRRYDPDNKEIYTDEYTAWVLYTVPREEMNRQIALAMETSIARDSALYDITIALARDILLQGFDINEKQSASVIQKTAADNYDPPGSIVAQALEEISLIDEYVIGRDVAAAILANYKIYDENPSLNDYINKILTTLVINSPRPASYNGFSAAIIDSDYINAFATPGGHIFITRGLLNAAKTEDALAAAIAHELSHIQLRHGMRAIRSNRNTEDWIRQFMLPGAGIIADRINSGFSHSQEFDADIAALSLLAASGYNIKGLTDMLSELNKNQSAPGSGGFSSTHPSPSSRLVNAAVAAARYPQTTDNSRFRQRRFDSIVK